ncbi:vomeronasal type-2 receptor 26-like [Eleutherodactylus coqui]|uniref:vomeronasal type-2 receptor 26-like n=1 Tax=Eleutherodactylus coqui TaxID=57060 RepID=UPI003461B2E6
MGNHVEENISEHGIYHPGEMIIGAIISVNGLRRHRGNLILRNESEESSTVCAYQEKYQTALTVLFAIDQINNNENLLPNITLGFHLLDSYMNEPITLEAYLKILSGWEFLVPNYKCRSEGHLLAMVGFPSSVLSQLVAKTFAMYGYPQISYGATDPLLRNKLMFPYSYHTVGSSVHLEKALNSVLKHFGWTWVGIIHSDVESNENAIQKLKYSITRGGGCIEFSEKFLSSLNYKDSEPERILKVISNSTATVIIFWADLEFVYNLYRLLENLTRTKRVWLLITDMDHLLMPTIDELDLSPFHGALEIQMRKKEIPGLMSFLWNITLGQYTECYFILYYKAIIYDCESLNGSVLIKTCKHNKTRKMRLLGSMTLVSSYPVYNAIYALAHALQMFMDSKYWKELHREKGALSHLLPWKTPPRSVCTDSCPVGFRKTTLEGKPTCCFDCVPCPIGEVTNHTDTISCWKCPDDQWPNEKKEKCIPKQVNYLSYQELLGTTLASSAVVLSVTALLTLIIFTHYQKSAVVKATNRNLSFLLLSSLTFTFCSCLAFIGYPGHKTCLLRQTVFGLCFTVSVSSVLAKTVLVVVAFRVTKPGSQLKRFIGQKLPFFIVGVCSSTQALICALWLGTCPPTLFFDLHSQPGQIVIECEEHIGFYIMLAYIGCLAMGCFFIAFPARNLPDRYNEAKFITFSMLVFFSVWITFIPTFLSTKGKYTVAVEVFAILVSAAGVLVCLFFPKCFIIFCTPGKSKMAARKWSRPSTKCANLWQF